MVNLKDNALIGRAAAVTAFEAISLKDLEAEFQERGLCWSRGFGGLFTSTESSHSTICRAIKGSVVSLELDTTPKAMTYLGEEPVSYLISVVASFGAGPNLLSSSIGTDKRLEGLPTLTALYQLRNKDWFLVKAFLAAIIPFGDWLPTRYTFHNLIVTDGNDNVK